MALPEGAGWQYEPKWDGFRCIAFRAGQAVELRAKSGKPRLAGAFRHALLDVGGLRQRSCEGRAEMITSA